MTTLVLAVFDAASTAGAAVQDLEAARIPSAVIKREVSGNTSAQSSVTVAVDGIHAAAVAGNPEPIRSAPNRSAHRLPWTRSAGRGDRG